MKPKALFVILGLLIACCALSAGVSAFRDFGQEEEPSEIPPSWMVPAGSVLERRLEIEDVSAAIPPDCRVALLTGVFELSPGDTCTLVIRASSSPLQPIRTLPLRLTQGHQAGVELDPHAEDRLTATQTMDSGEPQVNVKVFKEGGTLEIQCLPGIGTETDCRIEIVD